MLRRLLLLWLLLVVAGGGGYAAWRALQVEPPLQRAQRLIDRKQLFQAQVVLRGVIKAQPRNVEAHLMLARTQLATDDWLSAEKEAKTLRTLGYDRAVVSPILAEAYIKQGRYQDLLADIPSVAAKPEEQPMNMALRSQAFLGMKDVGLAQQLADAAAKLSPGDFLVQLQEARVALARNELGAALGWIDKALAQAPDDVEALSTKAQVLAARLDTLGAIAQLDLAVEQAPLDQDLRIARADLLLSVGSDRAARDDVQAVFAITPTNVHALFDNAILMLRNRQYQDADVEFDKLGDQVERFPKALFYKAQIALELGRRQSALEALDRFLRLQPGDGEGIRLSAQTQLEDGKPDLALAVLEPAVAPGSRDAGAFDLAGRAYFMLGRMPEAISSYRQAATIAPDNKDYAAHLAAAQVQFGAAPVPGADIMDLPP